MTILKLPGMQTQNAGAFDDGKCSGGLVAENRCPPRYPTGRFRFHRRGRIA